MAYRYGQDRNQMVLFPQTIDQYVPDEHPQILDECDRVDADEAQLNSMVSRADPQSNMMKGVQGTHPSYAVHNVVDDKNGLIAHTDAVNDAKDSNQLAEQVQGAESNLECSCKEACADAGYSDINQIDQIETDNRKVIVPSPHQVSHKGPKAFSKREFTYEAESDRYICPEGHCLVFRRYQNKEKTKRDYRIEKPALCRACKHFGECTGSKQGRTIVRHVNEALKEKIETRYCQPRGQKIYKRRKARVEHPFGYMKKNLGFGQFLLRGIQGAKAEASLAATCFNLTRMISLLGGIGMFTAKLAKV